MAVDNLSVFFPVVNEEENITSTVEKALSVLQKLKLKNYEILIIDDGSKDKTGEVADNLEKKYPKVRTFHQINGGYGSALKAGFNKTKYDWIVYTDGDGQFDFSEVTKFLGKANEGYELIIGYRIKRKDPFIRLLIAKGWAALLLIFFGLRLKDVDCGFKMVNRKVIGKISPLDSKRGGMINAELVIKAEKVGFKCTQVGVNHYPRLFGNSTGAGLKVIINSFFDLLKLWIKLT